MTPDGRHANSLAERFRTVQRLGRGGMGEVLLVHDEVRGQLLALKRMKSVGPGTLRQFKREFRSVERLDHPNIVRVYELGIDELGPYLLMEAIDGENLFAWCRSAPHDTPDAADAVTHSETYARGEPDECFPGSTLVTASLTGQPPSDSSEEVTRASTGDTIIETPESSVRQDPHRPLGFRALERLYGALPQLISALQYLHERGLVHRDIKPNNVLVDRNGVVKLLDFGILSEVGGEGRRRPFGTPGYIAPEQQLGEPAVPENDLYGLGALLFEVVTGHVPFSSNHEFVLRGCPGARSNSARALAPACPAWLDALISELLSNNPNRRPSLPHMRATLERSAGVFCRLAPESPLPVPAHLLERHDEQTALRQLVEETATSELRIAAVFGPSGQGKSALLEWARSHAGGSGLAAFESRTRFSERVSFNVVDGWIDQLATFIEDRKLDVEPELIALLWRASATFPTLGQLEGTRELASFAGAIRDPEATFDCVIELLERCAEITGGLVLFSDDLQWADADSVRFLRRLIHKKPRGVTLIAAVRDDLHSPAFARFWSQVDLTLRIVLPELSQEALVGIMERVAAESSRSIALPLAHAAASKCSGRAFLAVASARLLVRAGYEPKSGESPVEALLREYMGRGGTLERQLMALLAAMDVEVELADMARILRCAPGSIDDALMPAVRERLLQFVGPIVKRTYELSHDIVRRQVVESLTAEELEIAHAAIAAHLEERGDRPVELVRHLLASRQLTRAGQVAVEAAADAARQNAFELAADLYAVAIDNGAGDRNSLHHDRALSLERTGRYVDAAQEWHHLAVRTSGNEHIDAVLNQAKALLATHHLAAGRRTLAEARRARGLLHRGPELPAQLIAWLRYRGGPARLPTRARRAASDTTVAERDGTLAVLVAHFDPMSGFRHLLAARATFVNGGHNEHAAHVDLVLAYLAYFSERRYGRTELAERYLQSAQRLLGGPPQRAQGIAYGLERIVRGARAMHYSRWSNAARAFDESIEFFESIGQKGAFQHQFAWTLRLYTDRHRQRVPGYSTTLDTVRSVVQSGQDSALSCHVAFNSAVLELMRGDFSASRAAAEAGRRRWPNDEPSYQGFLLNLALLFCERYGDDAAASRRALVRTLRSHARFFPTRTTFGSDAIAHLAFFEAMALHQGAPGSSYRRVLRLARRCAHAPAFGTHLAFRAAAYASDSAGRPPSDAIRRLRFAEESAKRADQPIDMAIARYQRGLRVAGSEGERLCRSARELVLSAGAHLAILDEDWARR